MPDASPPSGATVPRDSHPFEVGEWTVHPDRNEIVRGAEEPVHLEPMSMRLLSLLAEQAGRTVSRDEIVERLWSGRAVTDDAVNRQIAKLRDAFGDDSRQPKVIRTVPKRGVQLIAPVVDVVEQARARGRRWGLVGAVAAVLVVGVLASLFAVRWIDRPAVDIKGELSERPLTSAVGLEINPSISADGKWLAYAAGPPADAPLKLMVRRLDGGVDRQVDLPIMSVSRAAWSPAGDRLALVLSGPCRIVILSVPDFAMRSTAPCRATVDGSLAWLDARRLVVSDHELGGPLRLFLVDIAGGTWRPITDPPPDTEGDVLPVADPAGQRVWFVRQTSSSRKGDVFQLDLRGDHLRQITHDDSEIRGVGLGGPGRLVVSSPRTGDHSSLWLVDLRRGDWTLMADDGDYWRLSGSADGRRTVVEKMSYDFALAAYKPDRTRPQALLTPSTKSDWAPWICGGSVAFLSSRSGAAQVWLAPRKGGEPRQLTSFARRVEEFSCSPDGRTVAAGVVANGAYDLYRVNTATGRSVLLTRLAARDHSPTFSGDGRTLYYSRLAGARRVLVSRDIATGVEKVLIIDGVRALESPDARSIYFTRSAHNSVWRYDFATGVAIPLGGVVNSFGKLDWTVGGGTAYIVTASTRLARLPLVTPATPEPRARIGAKVPDFTPDTGIAFDGDQLIYSRLAHLDVDLDMVERRR